jgi:hypothetical protein
MTDRENIIAKIKKCLALSASSNEHEAETALRQARRLMESHGVTDQDVLAADAEARWANAGAKKTPTNWEAVLARKIGDAFGCRVLFSLGGGCRGGRWAFVGCGAAPEVAQYAFDVLRRQAMRARSEHIRLNLSRCKTASKTRRGDLFSEGWIRSVTNTITAFAGTAQQGAVIDAYMSKNYPSTEGLKPNNRNEGKPLGNSELADYFAGEQAGVTARLDRGVSGADAPLALNPAGNHFSEHNMT